MKFKDIIGVDGVKNQLIESADNNRIAHAQLFVGEKGSSKLELAIAFSQYINCQEKSNQDSCGECESCKKHNNLTHPDLHLIYPVLITKNFKTPTSDNYLKQWRKEVAKNPYLNLNTWFNVFREENKTGKTGYIYTQEIENLHKKLALKNYESKYRVIIIWIPEKMQTRTSNKILKTLEDPPDKTIFLLISEQPEKIIKTIISRLQVVKIKPYTRDEKEKILIKKYLLKQEDISQLLSLTDGDLGEAIFLTETRILKENILEEFQEWMRICYSSNIKELVKWVNNRGKKGRMSQSSFLELSLKIIRSCLMIKISNNPPKNLTEKEKNFLTKFHPFIHEGNIIEITERIEESIRNIERNANTKIILFELSLQLMKLLKVNRKFVELNY